MKLTQYAKNLGFILWKMIAFLCAITSSNIFCVGKQPSFFVSKYIFNYFYIIYNKFKKLISKKILKNKTNSAAKITVAANSIYKNNNSVPNRVKNNNNIGNQALQNADYLYSEALKAALAKQILILKEQIIRLKDKCALLYLAHL